MINWISVNDQLPKQVNGMNLLCYVHIKYTHNGEERHANVYDWFEPCEDGDFYWAEHDEDVTHWIYAKDLPFPE